MDRRKYPAQQPATPPAAPEEAPSLATPFAWMGGSLLLAATTFLVSVIALFQGLASLFR